MSALKEMEDIAEVLRAIGFQVTTPAPEETGLDWETLSLEEAVAVKKDFLNDYFDVIAGADIVLIANCAKQGIEGYIGANALMEAACGHALGKPVVFLYPVREQPCQLEALAVSAGVLDGNPGLLEDFI